MAAPRSRRRSPKRTSGFVPQQAVYKHIVLLTDGISEEGDSMALTREAVANHVTISTVGLGQDVNRAFLEKVATSAEGKAVLPERPLGPGTAPAPRRRGAHRQHGGGEADHAEDREAGGDSRGRRHGKRARAARLCPLHGAPDFGHDPRWRTTPTRCSCAGSTASAAPRSSLPTRRIAGR